MPSRSSQTLKALNEPSHRASPPTAGARIGIRPAEARDLPATLALEHAIFTAHAISPRQMRSLQRNPNAIFLVATSGTALAGDAIALVRRHPTGKLSGRIYSVVVDPAHRGKKIGQKLTAALLRRLRQRGVERVYLEVEDTNAGAISIYMRLGFHIARPLKHYYGRGNHGVHMRLDLADK